MATTYRNGREAKVGDQVVGRDGYGKPVAGTLMSLDGADLLNALVMPPPAGPVWVTISDCSHADDGLHPKDKVAPGPLPE